MSHDTQQTVPALAGPRNPGREGAGIPAAGRGAALGWSRSKTGPSCPAITASSVAELIGDINAANTAGGSNTITLAPGKTFTRNAVDNTTDGATGLPVIAGGDNLTIVGNGDTIATEHRQGDAGVPPARRGRAERRCPCRT